MELDYVHTMSEHLADCHGTGVEIYARLNDLHEHTPDLGVAHCTFLAMVRIRILEQRINELTAELQRLELLTHDCY